MAETLRVGYVYVRNTFAGILSETDEGYSFSYDSDYLNTPDASIDNTTLEMLATESTTKGYTVPGVQKKLSLHLFSQNDKPRLTLVNYPTGYILFSNRK